MVGRPRAQHARLEDRAHAVALEEGREAADVVLVRMGQHQQVHAPVPRRQARVEERQQAVGIRPPVDQQAGAAVALDEDRVALAHIQDRRAHPAVGASRGDQHAGRGRHDRQGQDGQGLAPRHEAASRRTAGAVGAPAVAAEPPGKAAYG